MPDRPDSTPPSRPTVEHAQHSIGELALLLQWLLGRLEEIREDLPAEDEEEEDKMGADLIPLSVCFDLKGALEILCNDDIEPAIKSLEEAANLTAEGLRREFEERTGKVAP